MPPCVGALRVEGVSFEGFLAGVHVNDAVFALRPDYGAILLAVDGLVSGPATRTATRCCRGRNLSPPSSQGAAGGPAATRGAVAGGSARRWSTYSSHR